MIQQIVLTVFCIFFAYANYRAIKIDTRIRHAINGVFAGSYILFFSIEISWMLGLILLVEARLIFDTFLNIFRFIKSCGLIAAINYVPYQPKSIIDKMEKKVFGYNGIAPKIVYLLIVIGLNFLL